MPRLTVKAIQAAKGPTKLYDGHGLYLNVTASGTKSWVLRYQLHGKRRDMGLGSLYLFGLAEARERARQQLRLLADRVDPLAQRDAERNRKRLEDASAMTFRACAEAYIAAHKAGWRNAQHAQQWPQSLTDYVYPVFGALPVQAVNTALVMKALEPIWQTRTETASRVRGRIESVLDWAKARGYRDGENPARWRGHLDNLLPKRSKVQRVEHHAALPYAEIAALLAELRRQESIGARALEFAILTAGRSGEVVGARWEEIDMANRLWTVPGSRMKAGKEHRVPLSQAALAVLDQMAEVRHSDFVFPGAKPGAPVHRTAPLETLRRVRRDLTAHGFRSSFRDWAAEQTAFPAEVAEMALAHVVGNKVEAAYRRGDMFEKRRQLAEAWAKHCTAPATGGDNVVAIGAR